MLVQCAVSRVGRELEISSATFDVEVSDHCERLDDRRLARAVVANENGHRREFDLLDLSYRLQLKGELIPRRGVP